MSGWNAGYVSDTVYMATFCREATPSWMAAAAVFLGYRPPDLGKPFRYLDLGCGFGLNALAVAATSPRAEVWGFDFNPAHIEAARLLAEGAGLTNVHFADASFSDLAGRPAAALPDFDFIVLHGVLSWVSQDNQAALMRIIAQRLRPGGLVFVSYNVATSWDALAPVQALMHRLSIASTAPSHLAVGAALDRIDAIMAAGARYFADLPTLSGWPDGMRAQNPHYVAHEYMGREWHPMMFADVAARMRAAGCGYIGNALLHENVDSFSMPSGMVPLMREVSDPVLRETLRDFASCKAFRRDLYCRGGVPLSPMEHQCLLRDLTVVSLGRPPGERVAIQTPFGRLTGGDEIDRLLLAALEAGPATLAQLQACNGLEGVPFPELLEAVQLLMVGGYVHAALPASDPARSRAACARLNASIAETNRQCGEIRWLIAPAPGTAIGARVEETWAVAALLAGCPADVQALTATIAAGTSELRIQTAPEGHDADDPAAVERIIRDVVAGMLAHRIPALRRLGVLGADGRGGM